MMEDFKPCLCDVLPCTCGAIGTEWSYKYPAFIEDGGWINFELLTDYLIDRNITEYYRGPRDNMTDGEWHRIYHQTNTGMLFVFHSNIYDSYSFKPLILWADQYTYILKNRS